MNTDFINLTNENLTAMNIYVALSAVRSLIRVLMPNANGFPSG